MKWFENITLVNFKGLRVMYDPNKVMKHTVNFFYRHSGCIAASVSGRLHHIRSTLRLPLVHSEAQLLAVVRKTSLEFLRALVKYASVKQGFGPDTVVVNNKRVRIRKPSRTPNRIAKNGRLKVPPLRYTRWRCVGEPSIYVRLLVEGDVMENVLSYL